MIGLNYLKSGLSQIGIKKILIPVIISVLILLVFITAVDTDIPSLVCNNPTYINIGNVNITCNITESTLKNVSFAWNGSEFLLYDESVILLYNFDNRSTLGENATKVVDLSKYSTNSSVLYASFNSSGKYNGKFDFDGINNNMTTQDHVKFYGPDLSLSFWVNFKGLADNQDLISHVSSNRGFSCYLRSATAQGVRFFLGNGTGTTLIEDSTPTDYVANQWYQITFTFNSTTGNATIYRDSIFMKSAIIPAVNLTTSINLTIGRGFQGWLNGSMDDLIMWNRTLTTNEVVNLYDSQFTKYNDTFYSMNLYKRNLNASPIGDRIYNYSEIVVDSVNQINSTLVNLTRSPNLVNITSNFTNLIGIVRNDFYGTNVQSAEWINNNRTIDKNNDGILESYTNSTFQINSLLNSGMKYQRYDMGLNYYYSNTTNPSGVNLTTNIRAFKDMVKWAYTNNVKVLFIINYMPSWLADNSSGKCDNLYYCPPNNYTIYNNIVLDFLNNVTDNGKYNSTIELEMWNEPYGNFFMNTLSYDNISKATNYTAFYNKTYLAVKNIYPNMPFGGPSGYNITKTPNIYTTFLSNMSNQMDFLSGHFYAYEYINYNHSKTDISNIIDNCTFYNANCTRIVNSEWNVLNITLQNDTNGKSSRMYATVAYNYIDVLNNYPGNISMLNYHWTERYSYFNNPTSYPQYPYLWDSVSEKGLDSATENSYYPNFNLTQDLSTYCPIGSSVYSSSVSDASIVSLTCKKGNMSNIIFLNKDSEQARNISINTSLTAINNLLNYKTLNSFSALTNLTSVGYISSFGINYIGEDLKAPSIRIISPLFTYLNITSVSFNITLDEEGSFCKYTLNNWLNNISMTKNGINTFFYATNTSIGDGNYTVRFWCNDTLNNINNTVTKNFIIDTTYPNVSILSPSNSYDFAPTALPKPIDFSFSSNDTNINTCWYNVTGADVIASTRISCSNNNTYAQMYLNSYGSFLFNVYVNDSAGNQANSSIIFTIAKNPVSTYPGGGSPSISELNNTNVTNGSLGNITFYNATNPNQTSNGTITNFFKPLNEYSTTEIIIVSAVGISIIVLLFLLFKWIL